MLKGGVSYKHDNLLINVLSGIEWSSHCPLGSCSGNKPPRTVFEQCFDGVFPVNMGESWSLFSDIDYINWITGKAFHELLILEVYDRSRKMCPLPALTLKSWQHSVETQWRYGVWNIGDPSIWLLRERRLQSSLKLPRALINPVRRGREGVGWGQAELEGGDISKGSTQMLHWTPQYAPVKEMLTKYEGSIRWYRKQYSRQWCKIRISTHL